MTEEILSIREGEPAFLFNFEEGRRHSKLRAGRAVVERMNEVHDIVEEAV